MNDALNRALATAWQVDQPVDFFQRRPLLAHFTTVQCLEEILESKQLWLSNPLLMNDIQEVGFAHHKALEIVESYGPLRDALGDLFGDFLKAYQLKSNHFANGSVVDLYVTCFAEFDSEEHDGQLSMWRAYGDDGRGVAVVFNLAELEAIEDSPLILAKVSYFSDEDRAKSIELVVEAYANALVRHGVEAAAIAEVASQLFEKILFNSLFQKHEGFSEEKEWRLVYFPSRDPGGRLQNAKSYVVTNRGPVPKLKLPLRAESGVIDRSFNLFAAIKQVLIGPSISPGLAVTAVERMIFEKTGRSRQEILVRPCAIPYRSMR